MKAWLQKLFCYMLFRCSLLLCTQPNLKFVKHVSLLMQFTRRTIVRWRHAAIAAWMIVSICLVQPISAQQAPDRGMVWRAPDDHARAEQDLRKMVRTGVESIRTGLIRDEALLTLADTLGLGLYLDMPVSGLPAARLVDTLLYSRSVLDSVLSLARNHTSIRAIGLARHSDTSHPTACVYMEELARRIREAGPAYLQSYYVTRFLENDVCQDEVDLVLADLRDAADPILALRSWTGESDRPAFGVAALGVWVRNDTLRGVNVPASPERQARYLERYLPIMLSDTFSVRMPALFIFRWRDVRHEHADTAHDLNEPYLQRYGIHTAEDAERPALDVVEGIFTGRQSVFAFDSGTPPRPPTPWPTLLGWSVLAVLGIFYALSPRFRHMVPRYFQARFFFREAVREGRDVLLGASTVLLSALGAASGLVAFVILDAIRLTDAFSLAVRWLPTSIQGAISTLLARPIVLVILIGCVYVILLLAWTVVLSILSRRKYRVTPAQALMLVVWPRWPLLIVMVAAMVAAALPEANLYLVGGLAAAWMLISAASILRTIIDLAAVARVPVWVLPAAVVLSPAVLATAVCSVLMVEYLPEVEFVWHVVTRQ